MKSLSRYKYCIRESGREFCPGIRVTWRIVNVVVPSYHLLRHAVNSGIRNYPSCHNPAGCGTEKLHLSLSLSVCGSALLSQKTTYSVEHGALGFEFETN